MSSPLRHVFFILVKISFFFGFSSTLSTNKTIPCAIIEQNNTVVFDCSARSLKTVPVPSDYKSNSVELLLKENLIDVIDKSSFKDWQNLTKIDLSSNHYPNSKLVNPDHCKRGLKIINGTFSNVTKLEQLIIDYNYLCEIPPGLPDSITMLSFQHNNIFSINRTSFSRVRNLRILLLGHNCYYGNKCTSSLDIENGTFSDLKEMIVLNLSFTNITTVPQYLPPSLKELYLSNNRIKVIYRDDFKNLINLELLFLSGNCPRCYNAAYPCEPCTGKSSIEIDEFAFQNLVNLSVLHLGSTSLSRIPETWFQNTTRLRVLNLALNFLVTEMSTGQFLLYLPSLEVLDLSFNYNLRSYPKNINLSENFSHLISLRELHIRGYVFKEITAQNLAPLLKLQRLTILDLGINFVRTVNFEVFKHFPSLSILYLSENRISPFSESNNKSKSLVEFTNSQSKQIQTQDPLFLWYDSKYSPAIITPFNQLVKPQCSKYGKTLDLSLNSIFFIDPEEFSSFSDIACLNLSSNGIGQALNGSEFSHFSNLAYLDLSFNKLDFAYYSAFQELKQLEVLDVSYNRHYFIVEGVTHHLDFIENLHKLAILNLSWNEISTLTVSEIKSSSLKELRFAGNRLDILWTKGDGRYINLFRNFTNLSLLDISSNRIHIMSEEALLNLPISLTELYLTHNNLEYFPWKNLSYFKNLKVLDLSNNNLRMIIGNLSHYTKSLQTLIISHNSIQTLAEHFLFKAVSLTHLDLSYNLIQSINNSIFMTGSDNYLEVLKLKGNPLDCTCDIIDLVQWIMKNNVTIPRLATDVTCATPNNWRKKPIINFDYSACNVDTLALLLFLMTALVIVPLTIMPIMKHLFYWDVWYIYHWCRARLKCYRVCTSGSVYDAFITYDETDPAVTDWVYNELCHQIEDQGNKSILLCLEERDWEPGKAVIDNIAQSINQSRKTLFVLTKQYVRKGKFRTAFYLAMQKLMDENMDVIVLVLLQPVLQNSQYLRLRKKICKSSILEWPKNPKAKPLFWQNMKYVLLTENQNRYNNMYTDYIAM
ncbi:toll-like receptor 8 isoform X2 [Hyla sarda]|nr:toll-like receptor 8 isoform X2 [Hyla sarda]XP_056412154.1 toll-like receptor 8 isoform X2 [Hyla sarda]XP_056412155.1 toll-like receptor 8 isoform X2 [Hyla sarda]